MDFLYLWSGGSSHSGTRCVCLRGDIHGHTWFSASAEQVVGWMPSQWLKIFVLVSSWPHLKMRIILIPTLESSLKSTKQRPAKHTAPCSGKGAPCDLPLCFCFLPFSGGWVRGSQLDLCKAKWIEWCFSLLTTMHLWFHINQVYLVNVFLVVSFFLSLWRLSPVPSRTGFSNP